LTNGRILNMSLQSTVNMTIGMDVVCVWI
jgi:hypothetical protein